MTALYIVLAAVHLAAVVVTGILWTLIDVADLPKDGAIRKHYRDIRAVHFGSLYLAPLLLGLGWAFDELAVPWGHQIVFPIGLGSLLLFSGVAWLLPRPEDLPPFYYWIRGWPLAISMIGLSAFALSILWTAAVLIRFALA